MPSGGQYLIIEQEDDPQRKGLHWRMVVGGDISTQFVYAPALTGDDWSLVVSTIKFNDFSFSTSNNTQTIRPLDSFPTIIHWHFHPNSSN